MNGPLSTRKHRNIPMSKNHVDRHTCVCVNFVYTARTHNVILKKDEYKHILYMVVAHLYIPHLSVYIQHNILYKYI